MWSIEKRLTTVEAKISHGACNLFVPHKTSLRYTKHFLNKLIHVISSLTFVIETQSSLLPVCAYLDDPNKVGKCCVIQRKEVKKKKKIKSCLPGPHVVAVGWRGRRAVFLRWHMVFLSADRSTSLWPSRVSGRTAETGLISGAPSSPALPFPAALPTWFVSDLKFSACLIRAKEKLVTLELKYSDWISGVSEVFFCCCFRSWCFFFFSPLLDSESLWMTQNMRWEKHATNVWRENDHTRH